MSTTEVLREELGVWQMAWRQLETFLDRVDGMAKQDVSHAERYYAMLEIAAVVERNRPRRGRFALKPALRGTPRGKGLGTFGGSLDSEAIEARIPGPEDLEGAVFLLVGGDEGPVTPAVVQLVPSLTLFNVIDEDSGDAVGYSVPTYDFGKLSLPTTILAETGPFPDFLRQQAASRNIGTGFSSIPDPGSDEPDFIPWSVLRANRRAKAEGDLDPSLSSSPETFLDLSGSGWLAPDSSDLTSLRNQLASGATSLSASSQVVDAIASASAGAREDAARLAAVRSALDDLGLGELSDPLNTAHDRLDAVAGAYEDLLAALVGPGAIVNPGELATRLAAADLLVLDVALDALDGATAAKMDEVVNARIGYPDGPLRMLRTLEWSLHLQWVQQVRWYRFREPAILRPGMDALLRPFLRSAVALLSGTPTQFAHHDLVTTQTTMTRSNSLAVRKGSDATGALSGVVPGHVAIVGGDRPTLALVLGQDQGPASETRLVVAPLHVSMAAEPGLPGIPGMIDAGVPLSPGPALVTAAHLRRGGVPGHPERDALPQAIVGFWGRLALLMGKDALEELGIPTPEVPSGSVPLDVSVTGPFEAGGAQLLLENLPAAFLTAQGRQRVARPAELLLLRGKDAKGRVWQGAVEVASADVRKASEISGNEPVACPCGDPSGSVVVLTLQDSAFPETLESDISIHRSFRGFGRASLASGVLLPEEVDPDLRTRPPVWAGKPVNRHPELVAARRVLERWVGALR